MKIYGVIGWKNAGKTGLVERLVAEISGRGLRVATIKHTHHAFDLDRPGKDSYRHRAAGAHQVLLASYKRWALLSETGDGPEPDLPELVARLDPCDLVLIEGFKRDPHPKIEAHRAVTGKPLIALEDPWVRAIAADTAVASDLPVFDLDDTRAIADFILGDVGLAGRV